MDETLLEKMLALMQSENDGDAVMGLHGLQKLFADAGTGLEDALLFAAENIETLKKRAAPVVDHQAALPPSARVPVALSGMPQCRAAPQQGQIEIIVPGKTAGAPVVLPGAAADEAESIALNMKDVLVAAAINKSRLKLKLLDLKNKRGEVVEVALAGRIRARRHVAVARLGPRRARRSGRARRRFAQGGGQYFA